MTYVEKLEFGGRKIWEWLDLYGYIDFIDALNSSSSDKHRSMLWVCKILNFSLYIDCY